MDKKQARNNFKLTKLLHGIIIVYYPDSSHASLEREKNLYFIVHVIGTRVPYKYETIWLIQ